jgi:cytochrome c
MKPHLAFAVPVLLAFAALLSAEAPAATGAAPDGASLFRQRCQGCHSVTPGQVSALAPNLAGVVGRKAGSTGFAYSPAMKAAKLVWTRENIDHFLSGPSRMVPGTRMVIFIPDPAQRAALVDFLARTGH